MGVALVEGKISIYFPLGDCIVVLAPLLYLKIYLVVAELTAYGLDNNIVLS